MLHSCERHYGGQISGAQRCHPYASYASWDGSCRGCPGDDEKEEEAKEGSKFLGATMVANWEEAAIWALRQVDGRTPTRGPAIILQFHKDASRNVRRVTKQGGPENPAARHKFPESLGTRPEACCDVETSFQWWQILNPAIWLPGGQDYHRQVSSRCVPGHSWWAEGRSCHLPDNTPAMERDCNEFWRRWNVPHACAALDGKHCAIRCPPNSGSLYYNYKGVFSIVLLAMVDADYKFLWTDVGGYGSMSDAQIYNESDPKEALEDNTIGLPPADPLPHDDRNVPYFLLGDDAFGLRTYLMKPFALRGLTREEMIANYRFSRGRRVVENAFSILGQRWQILLGTMLQFPETAQVIVEACICLHNMMRLRYPGLQNAILDQEDEDHNIIPGAWRDGVELLELQRVRGANRVAVIAKRQREYLKMYFNSAAGSVPWQDRMIAL